MKHLVSFKLLTCNPCMLIFLSLLVTTFIPACIIFYSTFVFVNLEVKIGTLSSKDGNAKEDFDKIMNFCL